MYRSSLTILAAAGIALLLAAPAGAVTAYSTGFDAGYAPGALVGQPAGASPQWDYSAYSSNPGGAGDPWLSSANVAADPTDAANQVASFFGDCSGGAVHGASASVVVSGLSGSQDITFSQSAYFEASHSASQSLCMSALQFDGSGQWGGNQNLTFGNYGYFVKRYDAAAWEALQNGMVAWSLWNTSAGNYESIFVPKGTWATADVTFHMATQTADLVVTADGSTQQILGIPTSYVSTGVLNGQTRYDMYTDGESNVVGNILLDNVQITQVPEPMTLALLSLGGLALLRRRHG